MQELLNAVILDYKNPNKLFALASEYDRLEQGAAAFTFYMRAAEASLGETYEEKWLQYKSLIRMALIHDREDNRGHTVSGLLKHAISVLPSRQEAYYIFAKWLADRHEWRDALVYSEIGLSKETEDPLDNDLDINWNGVQGLHFVHAVTKWKTDGTDKSKSILFDFKYKIPHDKKYEDKIDNWLNQSGYPTTIKYTPDVDYKFKFPNIDLIEKNYSRHFQDMWVLSALNGKEKGIFIEIGSGDPVHFNNTLLLEEKFEWTGLSIDSSERFCYNHTRKRKTPVLRADAAQLDYNTLFSMHCFEAMTDFLRINAEQASIEALKKIPFNKYEFYVIQFQHNACWWGDDFKLQSRKILESLGYKLWANDISVDKQSNYEDWWLHPAVAVTKRHMKTNKPINFAWDYMVK